MQKPTPQFPVPAVNGRKKACEDNCLSYPPWSHVGSPTVLLLLRTNRPMRMDFPSIFLEHFRGPRKTVFCLKITRSKSAGNHGVLRPKSTNFQSLVFIPKTDKLLLWHLKRTNINRCLGGLRMEDQCERSPQTFLVNNFSFLQPWKQDDWCTFKWVLNTDCGFKAAAWTLENRNGNVQY